MHNEMTLPPGVLAELARLRWQIKKVFDELKNKLAETGAWASGAEAKKIQAIFICITQQLLRALDHWLASEHEFVRSANLSAARSASSKIAIRWQNEDTPTPPSVPPLQASPSTPSSSSAGYAPTSAYPLPGTI